MKILPPPRYRASQFRATDYDLDQAAHYLDDEELGRDPRMARIHRCETAVVEACLEALPAGATVADVPCGNGRMTRLACARGGLEVTALDLNESMLAAAREALGETGCSFVKADITGLPLPDSSVDLVISVRLLHHVPTHEGRVEVLGELARVCRGRIVTSFWSSHSWRYLRRRLRGKEIRGFPIPPAAFRAACADAGLVVDRLAPVRSWYEEQCMALCRPRGA